MTFEQMVTSYVAAQKLKGPRADECVDLMSAWRKACAGDLPAVERKIKNGLDVTRMYKDNASFLLAAVTGGNIDMVKLMLERGVDVNAATLAWGGAEQPGDNPLMAAICKKRADIVKVLLDAGADVNHQEIEPFRSPLISAIWREYTDIAKMLIEAGADVNYDGWSPDIETDEELYEQLLNFDEEAGVWERDSDEDPGNCTPLKLAKLHKMTEIEKILEAKNARLHARPDTAGADLKHLSERNELLSAKGTIPAMMTMIKMGMMPPSAEAEIKAAFAKLAPGMPLPKPRGLMGAMDSSDDDGGWD